MAYNKTAILTPNVAALVEPQPSLRLKQLQKLSGVGVIVDELHPDRDATAKFRVRVMHLQKIPREDWQKKQFRALKEGLFEIKWLSRNTQWRAMGYDLDKYFVVVKICTHKDNVYDPSECIAKSRKLKAAAEKGEMKVIAYEL